MIKCLHCTCTLRNTAVIDIVTQNITGYVMNMWLFSLVLVSWPDPVGTTCVLTVFWFSHFTFWNIFAKELYMLLQTSCQMALLYFSVVISNKTFCWNLWEGPLRWLMWPRGHSIQTFIILLELRLYMLGLWNECVDSGINSDDTCDLATVWCKPVWVGSVFTASLLKFITSCDLVYLNLLLIAERMLLACGYSELWKQSYWCQCKVKYSPYEGTCYKYSMSLCIIPHVSYTMIVMVAVFSLWNVLRQKKQLSRETSCHVYWLCSVWGICWGGRNDWLSIVY